MAYMVLSAQGIFKSSLHFVFDFNMGTKAGTGMDLIVDVCARSPLTASISSVTHQDHQLRVNMRKVSGETKVKLVKYESVSRPERCNRIVHWKLLVVDSRTSQCGCVYFSGLVQLCRCREHWI